jgi:hypothetical protein
VVGALASGKKERDEGKAGYVGRILRNAVLSGGLAAGATGLLGKAYSDAKDISDSPSPVLGEPGNEGPLATMAKGVLFSPGTALASGGLTLGLTDSNRLLGAGREQTARHLENFARNINRTVGGRHTVSPTDLEASSAKEIEDLISRAAREGGDAGRLTKMRRLAGLPGGAEIKLDSGILKDIPHKGMIEKSLTEGGRIGSTISRRGLSTFGQTLPRRAMRGGLGLAAVLAPAVLGAFMEGRKKHEDV